MKKVCLFFIYFFVGCINADAQSVDERIKLGWNELIQDNDTTALQIFNEAYIVAVHQNNLQGKADALLHLGIASYGTSMVKGFEYAGKAMKEYEKLKPPSNMLGRGKVLQLISTIKAREGKYEEAIALSKEALQIFLVRKDSSSYPGIIYSLLGKCYQKLKQADSSNYYTYKALDQRISQGDSIYLSSSYCKVADIELNQHQKEISKLHYDLGAQIAQTTKNRQSQITSLIGLGDWSFTYERASSNTENYLLQARQVAQSITDKSYLIRVLTKLKELKKNTGNYKEALLLGEEISKWQDTLANWEKTKLVKSLEVQFHVEEKDRQLSLVQKEKAIATLTNYLLYGALTLMIIIAVGIYYFLQRINKRDKILIQTKEQLMSVLENQKILKEKQLRNELEFKESQLSAVTLQMLQKNELLQELKEKTSGEVNNPLTTTLHKIINKGLNQDKEWTDFNSYFESINKNFYHRIKQSFPDISPNELKICALIKMNLSTKEMASILNISPDSVKTARYRLRKKLQLNTEDNLTDFILNLN